MSLRHLLTGTLTVLFVFLPFHVVVTIFTQYQLGIPGFVYFKEVLLLIAAGLLVLNYVKERKLLHIDSLDILIIAYVLTLIIISVFQGITPAGVVYGLRYDTEFLFAFLLARKSVPFLTVSIRTLLMQFIYSALLALLCGMLVKFIFSESILVLLGFSESVSQWEIGGAPPIYHGIPNANVQRFQGIWDGPNQAGFFLLTILGILLHAMTRRKNYGFLIGLLSLIILGMIVLTYSRSAFIGLVGGAIAFIISAIVQYFSHHSAGDFKRLMKKYWAPVGSSLLIVALVVGGFVFVNRWKLNELITREGSTNAHIERFLIGFERFKAHPFGSGLAEAGPAARSVHEVIHTNHGEFVAPEPGVNALSAKIAETAEYHLFTSETYYIPESWWVQQLVEGGIIGFLLFFVVMWTIGWRLLRRSPGLVLVFVAACIMNGVLHSFETMYASLALFMAMGLVIDTGGKSIQ